MLCISKLGPLDGYYRKRKRQNIWCLMIVNGPKICLVLSLWNLLRMSTFEDTTMLGGGGGIRRNGDR